jgi:hypothetical protein
MGCEQYVWHWWSRLCNHHRRHSSDNVRTSIQSSSSSHQERDRIQNQEGYFHLAWNSLGQALGWYQGDRHLASKILAQVEGWY